jgi:hypothetical protein
MEKKKKVKECIEPLYKIQRQIQVNRPHVQVIMSTENGDEDMDFLITKITKLLDKYA